jgi:hypothetical protein
MQRSHKCRCLEATIDRLNTGDKKAADMRSVYMNQTTTQCIGFNNRWSLRTPEVVRLMISLQQTSAALTP